MKYSRSAAVAAVMTALLFGCGDNTPTGTGRAPTADELTGTWNLNSVYRTTTYTVKRTGRPDSTIQDDTSFACTGNNDSVVFDTNGHYTLASDEAYIRNMNGTGTWTLSGGSLKMVPLLGTTTEIFASLNGTTMSFTTYSNFSYPLDTPIVLSNTMVVVGATKKQ